MPRRICIILLGTFLFCPYLASSPSRDLAECQRASKNEHERGLIGMPNPAATYCIEMGYEYKVIDEPSGQRGICIFLDGSQCNAWDFLKGKCGERYSYCAAHGYHMERRSDGQNEFSAEYAVCISDEGNLVGSVTELIGMSELCAGGSAKLPFERDKSPDQASLGLQPPATFDWRDHNEHNWMTSVKDQGGCGSCWAFSAVGVVEAVHNIRYDNPGLDLDLSEEYLVSDCYSYSGYQTCCGGWHNIALQYIREQGIPDEACMPYVDRVGCSCYPDTCQDNCYYKGYGVCSDATCSDRCADWQSRLVTIDSSDYVPSNPQIIKEYIVGKAPLAVSMGIGSDYGGYWDGDIYRCSNDNGANHAVVVLGYDDAAGYWIVKNSWGTDWGENGYFKVGYGECRIEDNVHYADKGTVPVAPSDCNASNSLCDIVHFSWQDNSGNEDGFIIYRNGTPADSVGANVTCYDDYSGIAGTTYSYCVRAYNNNGESDPCCDDGARVAPSPTPTNVTAECIDQYIHICWDDVAGELGYYVYRNGSLHDSVGANMSCHDDGDPGSGFQCYRISAYNSCGESPQSMSACDSCPDILETDSVCLAYGWNMASLPSLPPYSPVPRDSIFDWMPLYGYDCNTCSYYVPPYLDAGDGYWVARATPPDTCVTYPGTSISCYAETLCLVWNIIGATSEPVPFSTAVQNPQGCIIPHTLYWWDPVLRDYVLQDTLKPGRGYWVAAICPCTLTVSNAFVFPLAKAGATAEFRQPLWMASIFVTSDDRYGAPLVRQLGVSRDGTEGFEPGLDLVLPPAPVESKGLNAYFKNDGVFQHYARDIRGRGEPQVWNLGAFSKSSITLTWDVSQVPGGVELGLMYADRTIDLRQQTSVRATIEGAGDFKIVASHNSAGEIETRNTQVLPGFELFQCYPNPFNPQTTVEFYLPKDCRVCISVCDISGREAKTLVNRLLDAGQHTVSWDGTNADGKPVATGIYLCRMETGQFSKTIKMVLLR